MGFTENYLALRKRSGDSRQKKEEGTAAGETAASSASGSAVSGNDFTSRYLALRKQSSGAPDALANSQALGNLPGLSLPALPGASMGTQNAMGSMSARARLMEDAAVRHPRAEGTAPGLTLPSLPAAPAGEAAAYRGPEWAQSMVDRYKPENNQNIRENPVAAAEKRKQKAAEKGVDWRGIPTSQSPDGVRSQGHEKPTMMQRVGDMLSGAAKSYGAGLANMQANVYDLTQGGRDVMNQEYLEAAQLKYDQAKRDYDEALEMAETHPGDKHWQKDLEASRNMLEAAERELAAYGAVPEIQRNATEKSYAAADQLAASGQADVERAKAGLNGLGEFAVDVGVGGLQLGADITGGWATGGGTMLPLLLRSYGGGAQEARQEGATAGQAAAFGAASALTEALTEKISSLGNFQTKAFGSGALDDILEGVVGAVERIGKTEAGRKALNRAASAGVGFLSEGAEEFVSGIVSPLLKRAIYSKEPIDWKETMEEAAYEFLVGGGIGMISGGFGGTDTNQVQSQYLTGVTEKAQNDAYAAMGENLFSPEARQAARESLGRIDRAWERSGVEDIGLPRLELPGMPGAEAAQAVQGQKNSAPVGAEKTRLNMEDFVNTESPVWNNVDYSDTETQTEITQRVHREMTEAGEIVQIPESTMRQTAEAYPDLRGMKKSERAPILREKMNTLKSSLRQFLNGMKGTGFEFEVNGNVLEARLYSTGIREVMEKITRDKASMLYHSDDIFRNAKYLYSTQDYDGDPNVYRWNYFYSPVQIGDEITGVRIAVRDMATPRESQIYHWGIKESTSLDGEGRGGSRIPSGVSSDVPSVSGIPEDAALHKGVSLDGERRGPKVASFGVSSDTPPGGGNTDQLLNMPQSSPQFTPETPNGANISVNSIPQAGADVNSGSAVMMTGRLFRMGERGETAARLGELLGRAADGGSLTAAEWSEIQQNPNAAKLIDAANMLAARKQTGGQENAGQESAARVIPPEAERPLGHSPDGERLSDGQGERGAGADTGGQAGAVPGGKRPGADDIPAQRGGQAAAAGEAEGAVSETPSRVIPASPERPLGHSPKANAHAIARQDAVTASGARMVSTREYMGLDIGTDRPCLFEAPEEVIRGDRVLSEVYDEIWEMGYRPHFFTGTPETEADAFSFNGAVRGEDVFIRIDHQQYDADAIWEHEKFHILSGEDPGLVESAKRALLEKYGEEELDRRADEYLRRYAGAYGLPTLQGMDWSDGELDIIAEEMLADAYAEMGGFRTGGETFRDDVRRAASQREQDGHMARGPPEGAKFSIRETGDGKKYVQADRMVITGQDPEVWAEQVEDYINYKIRRGEDVALLTEDGDTLLLTRETAGKAKHAWRPDGSRMTDREYETKLNAEAHIDELAQVSRKGETRPDVGKRHGQFASKGWQYRKAYFRDFDGKYYQLDISVAQNEQGNVVYNIGKIRERSLSTTDFTASGSSVKDGAQGGKTSFHESIPQSSEEVKQSAAQSAADGTGRWAEGTMTVPGLQLMDDRDYSQAGRAEAGQPEGLRLRAVDEDGGDHIRFSADDTERRETAPASVRRTASRKLTEDLAELFPETQKSYLRDLADEIRTGARQERLDALFEDAYDSARVYDESPETDELREIAKELRGRRVYVDQAIREEFGDDWKTVRQFFFGKGLYFTNDSGDMGLDQLNSEMAGRFGGRFDENETDLWNIVSRLEYILRSGSSRQISLDEQARRYGGEEAAEQFREAYRQRFMDASERYRDAMSGIDEAKRNARETERQRRRQELEDYVAEARRTLRDRASQGLDAGKTDPRTHVPEGVAVDDYVQELEQRAARAREDRLRNTMREDFRGSEAMEKLGIRITGSVTDQYQNAAALRARQAAAEQARKAIRKAERRLNATEAEKQFAAGITSGVYTESDIPRTMDADKVMELADYYMGERAFGLDMLRQQKADISRVQQEKAKAIFGPALEASEGKQRLIGGLLGKMKLGDAFILNNRTAERNMRSIFGDEAGEKINQWLFAPVAENEGERYRFVNRMMDRVRTIEGKDGKKKTLTKAESALVQKVIEGRTAEEAAAGMQMGEAVRKAAEKLSEGGDMQEVAREFRLDEGNRKLARQYAQWMETQKELETAADTVKIENAVKLYSELYGQFYEAVNDFLTVHGYEPIGFIKGYAPHMQPKETTGALQKAFQALGVGADVSSLPTAIAGETKNFKPGKRWNQFFQTRHGEKTEYDIAGGFEKYVDSLSDVLYHTDDIARIREANKFLRRMYAQEEISENLSRAEELKYRSAAEKRAFLMDQGELDGNSALSAADIDRKMSDYADKLYDTVQNTTQYGQLAVYLDDYANHLAGKQVFADRDMERSMGRASLNVGNKLHRAFTRAQVSGNLSSVLNQTSQLPIIIAELGGKYTGHALRDNWNGRLRRGDWAQSSDFLTEKNGIDYITSTPQDMIVGALFKPADFADGFLSTLAVRGRYLKEIDAGKSHEEAMRIADRFGREVMGSRAKGSAPMAFQSKSIFNRMLHAFQLEALNTWEHLSQDLPREFRAIEKTNGKSAAARAVGGMAVKILLGNFLLNRAAEALYGGTPAQGDVFGILGNFVASGMGTTLNAALKDLINAGWEKVMGEPLFDGDDDDDEEERPFNMGEAMETLGSDMLNDAPLVSNFGALFGVGDLSLPMPDVGSNLKRAKAAWEDDGGFSWEVMRQLMGIAGDTIPGGRQAEKTFQGLDTALRGGRYSGYGEDEKLMYPVDVNPFTALQAALFGNSALEETGEYYASGEKALTQEQTKIYKSMIQNGADKKEIYNAILDWRRIKGDDELTGEEEARLCEDIVGGTSLDDREKLRFYRGLLPENSKGRADKLEKLMNAGMDWDGAIGAYAMYNELYNRENMTPNEKAGEFAKWADESYPQQQARAAKEQFKYYNMFPAEAKRYEKFTGAGLDTDAAYRVSEILAGLEPEPGKKQVSDMQRYKAVVSASAGLTKSEQLSALETLMSEGEFRKLKAGYDLGITPELYVSAKETIAGYDANGNGTISQDEARKAIKAMNGLTTEQKAALWQMQNKSWSADNNPFSRSTGRKVRNALSDEVEGLSLPEP